MESTDSTNRSRPELTTLEMAIHGITQAFIVILFLIVTYFSFSNGAVLFSWHPPLMVGGVSNFNKEQQQKLINHLQKDFFLITFFSPFFHTAVLHTDDKCYFGLFKQLLLDVQISTFVSSNFALDSSSFCSDIHFNWIFMHLHQ